jgi:hypothetical protein
MRGNRVVGKIWLLVILIALTTMNYAATYVLPYIGRYAPMYQGALFIATVWTGILIAAIWNKQGWARVVLAIFLLSFVAGQLVFMPDVIVHYPYLKEDGLSIILLLSLADIMAATFLIVSLDIRWLSRPSND